MDKYVKDKRVYQILYDRKQIERIKLMLLQKDKHYHIWHNIDPILWKLYNYVNKVRMISEQDRRTELFLRAAAK